MTRMLAAASSWLCWSCSPPVEGWRLVELLRCDGSDLVTVDHEIVFRRASGNSVEREPEKTTGFAVVLVDRTPRADSFARWGNEFDDAIRPQGGDRADRFAAHRASCAVLPVGVDDVDSGTESITRVVGRKGLWDQTGSAYTDDDSNDVSDNHEGCERNRDGNGDRKCA